MNVLKIGGTLLSIVQTMGPLAGPQGKAIASIAAILHDQILTPSQIEAKAPIPFVDKDHDGIADNIDADGGTVPAITDEMFKAAMVYIYANENTRPTVDLVIPPAQVGKFITGLYLAMLAVAPSRA